MALKKVTIGNCIIFALALAEVTSWTIDLPEVRKYFFEKNEMEKKYDDYKYKNGEERDGRVYYSNIEGNSKHNSEHFDEYENTAYAREYGYQSYMEKKVNSIVYKGSVYLEGLRKSLENYTQFLENCDRMKSRNGSSTASNSTSWRIPFESLNSTTIDNSTSIENSTMIDNSREERCREATKESEHVRRLSQLAMWATRELQDIAYARKYKKGDYHEMSKEENELILKLAWFLDRLAYYTGYEPAPRDFVQDDDKPFSSTTTPAPLSFVNAPDEVKRTMMDCLKSNASLPADERCRYPTPLPPIVQMMMEMNSNITGIPSMPTTSSSNRNGQVMPLASESRADPASEQSMELLIASDNHAPISNYPPYSNLPPILTDDSHVQKRSILFMPETEVSIAPKTKRLIEDDAAINFLKYYAKHKVWEGSNLKKYDTKSHIEEYEVKNDLASHKVQKREIENKKMKHLRLPENPFQDLSKYVQHKPGTNYVKDEEQADKIKATIEKMREVKPLASKRLLRKYNKLFRQKRSEKFEHDVDLPRESVDPQGDISYYVKNKPGTNYNSDLVQAVRVRTGLQQIFLNPNIETVRRYGANYNPLVPDPFFAGILKSMADF